MNNPPVQFSQNSVPRRSHTPNAQQLRSSVRQDKPHPQTARVASIQPDPLKKQERAQPLNRNIYRSTNIPTTRWRAVKVTSWINPLVKAELQRIAEREKLSISKIIAAFLEENIQQDIHAQHDALLYPMVRQIIREELRAFGNRIVFFLMRIAFAAEQARILITNVLDRMQEVSLDAFTDIVDRSHKTARRNIIQKTPQIKTLLEEWERSFPNEGEGDTRSGK